MIFSSADKMRQEGGGADEGGLYEMLQEYMVENEALRWVVDMLVDCV